MRSQLSGPHLRADGLFAVNCNKIALRFASWTDEPYSEKANFEDVGRCSDAWSKKNGRESRLSCAT